MGDLLGGIGDHDHPVGGGRHDLLLQERAAPALDQVQLGVELVRAVDRDVEPLRLVERDHLDPLLAGERGGSGRGRHAADLQPLLAHPLAEALHQPRSGRARAEPHPHPVLDQVGGAAGGHELGLVDWRELCLHVVVSGGCRSGPPIGEAPSAGEGQMTPIAPSCVANALASASALRWRGRDGARDHRGGRKPRKDSHVPLRLRHVQDRHRAVVVPHDGADGRRRAVSRQDPRRRLLGAGAQGIAARLARLHRRRARHRPRGDPRSGRLPPRELRRRGRRGGARADRVGEAGRARGPLRPRLRPRERPRLRLRPRPAGTRQRDDPDGDGCAGRRDPAGDLLFRGRRVRADRGRAGAGQGHRRRPARPVSFQDRRRDAGDGRGLGPLDRADEARERTLARHSCGTRRRDRADLGGDGRLHRPWPRGRGHPARGPQCPPPRGRNIRCAAGRARHQPRSAPHDQRLDERLRHGGERGERRRRAGRDGAHERRRGGGARDDPLLARPRAGRDAEPACRTSC